MDFTVIGRTPNTAKRLQEHAGPGQILIDEGTHQAIAKIVSAHPIELRGLNGRYHSGEVYEVLAARELATV
jgi:adenylate cyclase